uniref:G protein alpha subunit n=1 Tax=Panagrolaimus sp. JU765 TaxID=591449 RepID=A0AC34RRN6_9BILA
MATINIREQNKRNRVINQELEIDKKLQDSTIKLLLLGAGESGKSTILKQMKIIHNHGFTDIEVAAKRNMVYANVLQSVKALLDGMYKLKLPLHSERARDVAQMINKIVLANEEARPLTDEIFEGVKVLLADKGFQMAIHRNTEFYLPDSAL